MAPPVWPVPPVWLALLACALLALVFHRAAARLLRLGGRTLLALASLALLKLVGAGVGLGLGVNLLNALVVALLGVPGLGLLFMLNWVSML